MRTGSSCRLATQSDLIAISCRTGAELTTVLNYGTGIGWRQFHCEHGVSRPSLAETIVQVSVAWLPTSTRGDRLEEEFTRNRLTPAAGNRLNRKEQGVTDHQGRSRRAWRERKTMTINSTCVTVGVAIMLAASGLAYAQDQETESAERHERGATAINAVRDTLGLSDEQVDRILEIRRERPPRTQSREEFDNWREGQQSKIESILTADQQSKISELIKAREQMQALAGATALGLVQGSRGGFGPGARGPRGKRGRLEPGIRSRGNVSRRGPRARGWAPRRGVRGFRSSRRDFGPGRSRRRAMRSTDQGPVMGRPHVRDR